MRRKNKKRAPVPNFLEGLIWGFSSEKGTFRGLKRDPLPVLTTKDFSITQGTLPEEEEDNVEVLPVYLL